MAVVHVAAGLPLILLLRLIRLVGVFCGRFDPRPKR